MKLLLIDHYDSFTYNLIHLIKTHHPQITLIVKRKHDASFKEVKAEGLILSPGPMSVKESGISMAALEQYHSKPVLGVCLGMQIINEAFGGKTVPSVSPTHGQAVSIRHQNTPLFDGIPQTFQVARYNSLRCEVNSSAFKTSATENASHEPMVIEHHSMRMVGVQFHPESFLSRYGDRLIRNFFKHYVHGS